jgi:hypothetical protein
LHTSFKKLLTDQPLKDAHQYTKELYGFEPITPNYVHREGSDEKKKIMIEKIKSNNWPAYTLNLVEDGNFLAPVLFEPITNSIHLFKELLS